MHGILGAGARVAHASVPKRVLSLYESCDACRPSGYSRAESC